jgi:hypothetical protein
MTESDWLTCTEPQAMLDFLQSCGHVRERQLLLFTAARVERLAALLPDPRQRRGIELLAQLSEGTVTRTIATDGPDYIALMLYRELCSLSIPVNSLQAPAGLVDRAQERQEQARLIRCLSGNPFRPLPRLDPAWLTPRVLSLAKGIYDRRAFDHLPELASLLEDAGCREAALLGHLRGPGPHARGCHVLDALLGRS